MKAKGKVILTSFIVLAILTTIVWVSMPYIKFIEVTFFNMEFIVNVLIDLILIIPIVTLGTDLMNNPKFNKYSNPNRNIKIVLLIILFVLAIYQTISVAKYIRYGKYVFRWTKLLWR